MNGLLLSLVMLPAADPHEKTNPLYRELRQAGLVVAGKSQAVLPPPSLADGLDADAQQAAITGLPGRRVPTAELLREAVAAPFVLSIGDIKSVDREPRWRRIDLWFVTFGDLEAAVKAKGEGDPFMGKKTQSHVLTETELLARKIRIAPADRKDNRFAHVTFSLLGRVEVAGTLHTRASRSNESMVMAVQLDPRFTHDRTFPNRWRSMETGPDGIIYGDHAPYTVNLSYLKVTRLRKPAGALLVEYHALFEQPRGWFNGHDLLRSKLPIALQSGVRNFREDLRKAR